MRSIRDLAKGGTQNRRNLEYPVECQPFRLYDNLRNMLLRSQASVGGAQQESVKVHILYDTVRREILQED